MVEEPAPDAVPGAEVPSRSRAARLVWAGIGWLFFGMGVAGIFLPLVPTTPFMLLALWGFSKSSAKLESWLLQHKRFGPPLQRWRAHRVIPWSAKLISWGSMLASMSWMIFVSKVSWTALIGAGAVMAYGAWFIARCPSKPRT